jgi:hypothetical protein
MVYSFPDSLSAAKHLEGLWPAFQSDKFCESLDRKHGAEYPRLEYTVAQKRPNQALFCEIDRAKAINGRQQ